MAILCLVCDNPSKSMIKVYFSIFVSIVSVVVFAINGWNGHWMVGGSILVAGLTLAAQLFLGFIWAPEKPFVKFGYGCSVALCIIAIVSEHRVFETGRAEVQAIGLSAFVSLEPHQCANWPQNFMSWKERGVEACALQNTSDLIDVAQSIHKAEKLPGELAVADGVYQLSQPETQDRCVSMLKELARMCPNVLSLQDRRKIDSL